MSLRRVDGRLAFEAPPLIRSGPVAPEDLARVRRVLRVDGADIVASQWLDNGPGWVGVLLASAEAVLAVEPALPEGWAGGTIDIGVAGPYPARLGMRLRGARHLQRRPRPPGRGPRHRQPQRLAGPVAGGQRPRRAPYVASQGTLLGRTGRPHISQDEDGAIWVAGDTITVVEGVVELG